MQFDFHIGIKYLNAPDLQRETSIAKTTAQIRSKTYQAVSGKFTDITAPSFVVGLQAFSWSLQGELADQGRYFEGVQFKVAPSDAQGYNSEVGIIAPLTVFPSMVTTTMRVVGISSQHITLGHRQEASVTVCEDDRTTGFNCTKRGLIPQLCASETRLIHHCSETNLNQLRPSSKLKDSVLAG